MSNRMRKRNTPMMIFPVDNLIECRIVERLNRFVVRVEISGKPHAMHINNTGRLEEFFVRGRKAFCTEIKRPGKTDGRLFAVEERGLGALIDTQLQMKAFEHLVEKGQVPWLKECSIQKRNPRLGASVLDYLLKCKKKDILLEVKSAVLREGEFAMYPDCPTTRGQRHVRELSEYTKKGGIAYIVFMAALPEVSAFTPYKRGDPLLFEYLLNARKWGVTIKAIGLYFDPRDSHVHLSDPDLPVVLSDTHS
jgi:sugar fermentation stimulation protein A